MPEELREAWITGLGMVSCLGEGLEAHWRALSDAKPSVDTTSFSPYVIHPLAPISLDAQIPKKSDQRQMEPWQRIGTYAAGLALDSAGIKGNADVLARTDMIVAAAGGERDVSVDGAILNTLMSSNAPAAVLNERLMNDLRPTLFLAQLSNLLAGNISIVHGVTGSSRTFMGEEAAGIDAVRVAVARIAAGQSDIALVGGACNAERKDMLLIYAFNNSLLRDAHKPIWAREQEPGIALGSMGSFLVVESRAHADARAVKPLARLSVVLSDRSDRVSDGPASALQQMWDKLAPKLRTGEYAVISGATGIEPATSRERSFLATLGVPVRATGTLIGHSFEPQFAMNIAIAALALQQDHLFPAADPTGFETPQKGPISQIVVTGVGHWRGEGVALVERI